MREKDCDNNGGTRSAGNEEEIRRKERRPEDRNNIILSLFKTEIKKMFRQTKLRT